MNNGTEFSCRNYKKKRWGKMLTKQERLSSRKTQNQNDAACEAHWPSEHVTLFVDVVERICVFQCGRKTFTIESFQIAITKASAPKLKLRFYVCFLVSGEFITCSWLFLHVFTHSRNVIIVLCWSSFLHVSFIRTMKWIRQSKRWHKI